jgi:serine/threonine protein phosphatase PrpC
MSSAWRARSEWASLAPADLASALSQNFDAVLRAASDAGDLCGAKNGARANASATAHIGGRDYMEDGFVLGDDFAAVVDGHGGAHTMKLVTTLLASQEFKNARASLNRGGARDVETLVRRARGSVAELSDAVDAARTDDGATLALVTRDRIARPRNRSSDGRTLVARDMIAMRGGLAPPESPDVIDVVTVASLGDSRVLLIPATQGVSVQQVHQDHNTSNEREVVRVEKFKPLCSMRLNGRLMLTRSLGDAAFIDAGLSRAPEVSVIRTQPGDCIVIASDGVFETLSNEKVAHALRALRAAANARSQSVNLAAMLVWLAKTTGSHDNVTAVVMSI